VGGGGRKEKTGTGTGDECHMCGEKYGIKLVAVVVSLYLILAHTTLAFSPPLIHYGSSSRLQLSANIYISILSPSQHSYSRINHFRFHFTNNELKKQIE
jgi:hypothetical protein